MNCGCAHVNANHSIKFLCSNQSRGSKCWKQSFHSQTELINLTFFSFKPSSSEFICPDYRLPGLRRPMAICAAPGAVPAIGRPSACRGGAAPVMSATTDSDASQLLPASIPATGKGLNQYELRWGKPHELDLLAILSTEAFTPRGSW
jgi:hypothetical protein